MPNSPYIRQKKMNLILFTMNKTRVTYNLEFKATTADLHLKEGMR